MNYVFSFVKKALPDGAVNCVFSAVDFVRVLFEAARSKGFLEGSCKKAIGGCDAETLFNRMEGISVSDMQRAFISEVKTHLKNLKSLGLLRKVELAADITEDAYYGEERSEWIHDFRPKPGSTGCFKYMALSIVHNGVKSVLAYRPLKRKEKQEKVLEEVLKEVLPELKVKVVLLDRGFCSAQVIKMLESLHLKYLIFWKKCECHREFFHKMGRKKFRRNKHRIRLRDGSYVETTMVYVKGIKIKGDKKAYEWVFATNLPRERPIHYIYTYKHRWSIETNFRVLDDLQIKTKTTDMVKRLFLSLFTVLLHNQWKVFQMFSGLITGFIEFAGYYLEEVEKQIPKIEPKKRQKQIQDAVDELFFKKRKTQAA
jgi:hypothetical protein